MHLKFAKRYLLGALFLTTTFILFTTVFANIKRASAASTNDFVAGNIINDAVFYNKDTMTAQQIQSFLNQLIPSCDTWGTQQSGYGSLTNAEYAQQIMGWHGPPYACITNYHENPSTGETSFERGGGAFTGGVSAAQIIYNAAQEYGINPQVLLVLLKKESAGPLTADMWPLKSQYRWAMGYGCPDSGPGYSASCDSQREGFYKQMSTAAWQLKYYKEHPNDYRYKLGWNAIQYSPDPACGTKDVYIENIATLSLYIYTPYTPNDAALSNYPGTAPCGAYGNRNFFMFFSEWFGSTQKDMFSNMNVGRKLVAKSSVSKVDPITGKAVPGQVINSGQVVKYASKTYTLNNNKLCLRTESNTITKDQMCVLYDNLQEGPSFSGITRIRLIANEDMLKIDPIDSLPVPDQSVTKGQIVEYSSQTTTRVDNKICLRTTANTTNGLVACVLRDKLSELPSFSSLASPRLLVAINTVQKIDPYEEGQISNQTIYKGMLIEFSSQIYTAKTNRSCVRTTLNTQSNLNMCVPSSNFKEYVNSNFVNMNTARDLKTNKVTSKIDPTNGEKIEDLPSNLQITFSQKTYHNNNLCLRTKADEILNKQTCVLYSNLAEF